MHLAEVSYSRHLAQSNVCQTQRKDWIEKDGLLEIHLQSIPLSFEIIHEKNWIVRLDY